VRATTPCKRIVKREPPVVYDFLDETRKEIVETLHRLETANGFCSSQNRCKTGIWPVPNHDNITHLTRHTISELSRAKMVDWMFEVLTTFQMSEQSFFLAVQYMDRFLEKTPRIVSQSDVHLLGITSMFIACKYEDIIPIHIKAMVTKVSHNRLSAAQIYAQEREIVSTLRFKMSSVPTSLEFLTAYLTDDYWLASLGEKKKEWVTKMATFLCLICLHHI